MKRVLFVTNGHGEQAIAARIAKELGAIGGVAIDHLSLVGDDVATTELLRPVGPRRRMPSGGLVAMGNVRNLLRDVRAGLIAHTIAQLRFLRSQKCRYDLALAVGDTFAYVMARRARARKTAFVGTAKSVYVARYGPAEVRILRSADAVFVRDGAKAEDLAKRGADASAPGNVIVDLFDDDTRPNGALQGRTLAIFPGSRESAYDDAAFACAIVGQLLAKMPDIEASLSIAPGLDALRFAQVFRADGWDVSGPEDSSIPFVLRADGRRVITAWSGSPAAMLRSAQIVLGQAGTVNEAAAARGIPVVAFERRARSTQWYRRRQSGLLNGALVVLHGSAQSVATELAALFFDERRRDAMAAIGRRRMGPPGGARAIAMRLSELLQC
ncbi:MAG: hypothetical protein JOZ59_03505 [Candidatus Eremiobacteraeota bacterium]|nr:hypothetical protein [Candidatus Eremiobacteraeota bacterium]